MANYGGIAMASPMDGNDPTMGQNMPMPMKKTIAAKAEKPTRRKKRPTILQNVPQELTAGGQMGNGNGQAGGGY